MEWQPISRQLRRGWSKLVRKCSSCDLALELTQTVCCATIGPCAVSFLIGHSGQRMCCIRLLRGACSGFVHTGLAHSSVSSEPRQQHQPRNDAVTFE